MRQVDSEQNARYAAILLHAFFVTFIAILFACIPCCCIRTGFEMAGGRI